MRIAVVGCGNMGMAYTHSFIKKGLATEETLLLIENNIPKSEDLQKLNIGKVKNHISSEIADYNYIILAVKPQDFETTANQIKPFVSNSHVFISIMAGMTIHKMKTLLGSEKIVRAMPNTPSQINMGVTAYTTDPSISSIEHQNIESILASTGKVVALESEDLLNAVTAVSGSGPAYYYYFVKSMIEAGIKMGMTQEMAAMLVKQTMLGSYHLMENSDKNLDELIASVKSKGGTTEAALNHLESNQVGSHISDALLKAESRAKELAK